MADQTETTPIEAPIEAPPVIDTPADVSTEQPEPQVLNPLPDVETASENASAAASGAADPEVSVGFENNDTPAPAPAPAPLNQRDRYTLELRTFSDGERVAIAQGAPMGGYSYGETPYLNEIYIDVTVGSGLPANITRGVISGPVAINV